MVLIRKITLFAQAEAIKQSADDDERMNAMLGVAVEPLFDGSSLDNACRGADHGSVRLRPAAASCALTAWSTFP